MKLVLLLCFNHAAIPEMFVMYFLRPGISGFSCHTDSPQPTASKSSSRFHLYTAKWHSYSMYVAVSCTQQNIRDLDPNMAKLLFLLLPQTLFA